MNNETKNINSKNNSSSLPMVIIGLVLLAAIAGGYWFYQNSKSATTVKSNANSAVKKKDNGAALQAYQNAPPGAQPANMLGSPNASVTIEEFADFQCPTCATVHTKMKEINAIYGSRIKFIYRSFPLTQIHKNAYDAAVAAEAAGLQGKYWDMQNQLFTNQQAWANSSEARKMFGEYAQKIGLDVNKFETETLGLAAKRRVDLDLARARALKVNSTPTIFINGRELTQQQFDVSAMRQIIDAELLRTQAGSGQTSNQSAPANQMTNPTTSGEAKKDAANSSEKK